MADRPAFHQYQARRQAPPLWPPAGRPALADRPALCQDPALLQAGPRDFPAGIRALARRARALRRGPARLPDPQALARQAPHRGPARPSPEHRRRARHPVRHPVRRAPRHRPPRAPGRARGPRRTAIPACRRRRSCRSSRARGGAGAAPPWPRRAAPGPRLSLPPRSPCGALQTRVSCLSPGRPCAAAARAAPCPG